MEIAVVWIGVAIACAIVASNKGRSGFGWFIMGLLFSLISLLIVLVLPKVDEDTPSEETHVKCPDCAELVRREARICKHCGCKLVPQ
jgi:hypothetical protein